MANSIIGVNIIETLTTGMYKDPKTIFREYIQNSCDAIDVAMKSGLLAIGESSIKITINENYICIEDNGSGIPALDFKQTLSNIADSQKTIDANKGFRGIGRLCGLVYCDKLTFTAKANNENSASVMSFDAKKLRDNFYKGSDLTANQVLDKIITVKNNPAETNLHGFKVELEGNINESLLDVGNVKSYLSFVAPVRYSDNFSKFSPRIYEYAKSIGFKIDEYNISLNDEQIVKEYTTEFYIGKNKDEIFDLSFQNFYGMDENGNRILIAWAWNGLSGFKGLMTDKSNIAMRSIRLRKGNIQIGEDNAFPANLFKDPRTPYYLVGEVFAVNHNLIPNSQRDYFIYNPVRNAFEDWVKCLFDDLWNIVRSASNINAAKKDIKKYNTAVENFSNNDAEDAPAHTAKMKLDLDILNNNAIDAKTKIDNCIDKVIDNSDTDLFKVVSFLTQNNNEITLKEANSAGSAPPPICLDVRKYLEQILSQIDYNNDTKKEFAVKILDTIYENTDGETYDRLIEKIAEALK